MPYQAEISRDNPTCFLFVIDQSGSMDEITAGGRSKADFVADVLNKTLYTLVTSCSKSDGVRNYFDVGVIAYGGSEVASGFGGALSGGIVHPINAISEHTLRIEERQRRWTTAPVASSS
jgi:CO dehydrogenase/acetyl-CoA synthase gamma subunit (corrinoid Fe-S protein)